MGRENGSRLRRVSELRRSAREREAAGPTPARSRWTLFVLAPGRDTPMRLRLSRPLLALVVLAVIGGALGAWRLWEQNRQLEAELAALRQTQALTDVREDELQTVLAGQKDKLADQDTRLQTQDAQISTIADDLADLKSRMANLDRHNAQLREVLGIDTSIAPTEAQGGELQVPTSTPTPTPPESNSLQEINKKASHNFLFISSFSLPGAPTLNSLPMGGDDPPPDEETSNLRSPDESRQLLENFRQDITVLRDELTERQAEMSDLDTHTAQRVAEWATAVDEQPAGPDSPEIVAALAEAQAQAEAPAIQPPVAPQPKPKPPPVVRSSIPAGLPYYGYISSPFGWRNSPFNPGTRTYHKGMDIIASIGTRVRATQAGMVIVAGWTNGYGRTVMIDHGKGWVTIYGHNSQVKVKVGQWVDKGQIIALSGNTGPSTGPHIHYEIRYKGTPVNPAKYR